MNKSKEKFGWVNGATSKSRKVFVNAIAAARAGINANPGNAEYVYVVSSTRGYIGSANGINFHAK